MKQYDFALLFYTMIVLIEKEKENLWPDAIELNLNFGNILFPFASL